MASLKSQQQLYGDSISEPESLELDYDMWQGQFDFIGGGGHKTPSSDDSLNLCFERLEPTKTPILIDEETFLSLHPHDLADGPHSGLFFDQPPPPPPSALTGSGGGRKSKRIDNFFNSNLQKQKILFMNDKNVTDSLEREKPESSGDDEEFRGERRSISDCDINNNNNNMANIKGRNILDNRLLIRNKCDTLNDQVRVEREATDREGGRNILIETIGVVGEILIIIG